MTQHELENAITVAALRLATALTPELRMIAWQELEGLHKRRTDEAIRALEEQRGLR